MTDSTVEVDAEALEELTDFAADEIKNHMGPEMDDLEAAVRDAYDALDE